MIFRIFMILFAVNLAVFWMKAHASQPSLSDTRLPAVQIAGQTQAALTGSLQRHDRHQQQQLTELGVRLLRWEFKSHASRHGQDTKKITMVPSISIIPRGATFNMRWHF